MFKLWNHSKKIICVPAQKNSINAIVGFIIALISLIGCMFPVVGFLFSIGGLICSIVGLKECQTRNLKGNGLAVAGIILSIIALIMTLLLVLIVFAVLKTNLY